ncbi:hypothetical protein DY000_02022118 [Brassica cretica]|uniref:Uncharacterized protein n=1 Tax=Brassica cretica TaxID=69181 RepID=A0ABQ7E1K5_BRACR|nr:hypothetical protein DY000_02022118 [Brassica cretica]
MRPAKPPAWRTLIALQNLGDLYGLVIGVADVLCSYSVSPLSGAEWRYCLHPRGKEPPVREVPKNERKRLPAFEGNWTEKFAFMHLPGFSSIWQLEDLPRVDYSSEKDTIEQVLKLPLEQRQIPFLVSKAALKRCSIWGEMSGSKGDEALAEYKKALEVMSARKAAPNRAASTEDDEVQFIRSGKCHAGAAAAPSSSKWRSKASDSSPKDSPSAPYDWATLLNNLNTKEKDAALAKDKEIKELRLKVRNQEEAGELAATENVSLRGQLKKREEELNDLKDAAETFDAEKVMAVSGAKVVSRWELMREWLSGQTDSWDPVNTLEQYKMVKTTEAELLGLPPPSFEYEPQVPGGEEVKKASEPDADDPPVDRSRSPLFVLSTPLRALVDDIRIASAMVSSFERMQVARWPWGLETWLMNRRFPGTFVLCDDQTSWVSYEWISSRDPGVGWRILIILGPGGHFLGNPWVSDTEGPHSAILGEAILGTCWGIAFYRSEAGHYRVPVLHAVFCRKPLSVLEGAGVGENSSARLCYFPCLEKQDIIGCFRTFALAQGQLYPVSPRPGSEVFCLAKRLHPVSVRCPLLQICPIVLGDLIYVRRGTRVLRGPGPASKCNLEGLRGRPCVAVDIGSLGIPWVLGMIQGPPSPERPPITCIIDL